MLRWLILWWWQSQLLHLSIQRREDSPLQSHSFHTFNIYLI
jgi:hypothetical protein